MDGAKLFNFYYVYAVSEFGDFILSDGSIDAVAQVSRFGSARGSYQQSDIAESSNMARALVRFRAARGRVGEDADVFA